MIDAVNCKLGENVALRGSGFGPWTAQDSLIVDDWDVKERDWGRRNSSSKYDEPEAEGMSPVCKNILRSSFGFLTREMGVFWTLRKVGGAVAPAGPLMRRRSLMTSSDGAERTDGQNDDHKRSHEL